MHLSLSTYGEVGYCHEGMYLLAQHITWYLTYSPEEPHCVRIFNLPTRHEFLEKG